MQNQFILGGQDSNQNNKRIICFTQSYSHMKYYDHFKTLFLCQSPNLDFKNVHCYTFIQSESDLLRLRQRQVRGLRVRRQPHGSHGGTRYSISSMAVFVIYGFLEFYYPLFQRKCVTLITRKYIFIVYFNGFLSKNSKN